MSGMESNVCDYFERIKDLKKVTCKLYRQTVSTSETQLPQQHVCKEEVLADRQLCNQESNSSLGRDNPEPPQIKEELCTSLDQDNPEPSQIKEEQEELCTSLDQDNPEPPQIKEEQEELCTSLDQDNPELPHIKEEQEEICTSLEGEQLVLMQETEDFLLTPTCEESDNSEDLTLKFSHRRLLDIIWKPVIKLHRIELPQQHVCKEEEVLPDQQLCNQKRNSSLDQDHPEPPQIKEEQEEVCTSLEGEPLILKQETQTLMLTLTCEESDNSEYQTLDLSPDETQRAAEKEHIVIMSVKGSVEPEPHSDDKLLSYNSHVVESQDHKGGKHEGSGSTGNAGPKLKRHHRSKNYTNNEDTSKIHSNIDTGKQCFKCDTCGKRVSHLENLKVHRRTHTGEKPYPCNNCEKRFSLLGQLKCHMRVHTGQKRYPCNICEKRFSQLCHLKEHIRVHTGEKPYPCNTCEKRFSQLCTLKEHMRVHTGEKPYPCNTCEKRFSKLRTLKEHMRVHTGQKPYPCNTCEKRFSQLGHLKNHMRVHTGEKPYPCNTCEKRFSQLVTLQRHMRVHTGEKPYPCNTCKKRFSQLRTLKDHMRVHTCEAV